VRAIALALTALACITLGPITGPYVLAQVGARVGGKTSPAGVEIQCDLPDSEQKHNIASKGLGCCVFRSLDHASRYQNCPQLWGMPEWMVQKGIAGGGYPEKVVRLVEQISKDRGMPVPRLVQVTGKDLEILRLATRTGRMPCVTYGWSPSGRYNNQKIAHMVNAPHADPQHFAILDNNYVGSDKYEWLTPEEFLKAYGSGWAVILLNAPPPPIPKN
jgi:hypothetical protein